MQRVTLEDGRQTRKLEYNYEKEGKGRGVCNCATSTKRKLEHCDADDKQSDTIIAWSLPHTADRFFVFSLVILQGVFFNWSSPKNHKFFSVSKMFQNFELGPP